jgi:hypothetical protein
MSEQGKQAGTSTAELGQPVAYLALQEGTPVYDRTGERVGVRRAWDWISGQL